MFYTDTAIQFLVAPNACAFPVSANYSVLIGAFVTFAQICASFTDNCENMNINILINNFYEKNQFSINYSVLHLFLKHLSNL